MTLSQDDQLIKSLLTQFQYCSVHTIQAEAKCRTYTQALQKLESYLGREAYATEDLASIKVNICYMVCFEDLQTFDVTTVLITKEDLLKGFDGKRVVSKYAYCIGLGDLDEERKANIEDEEIRCAQELYEGYRAEEVEYPVVKAITADVDNEMLEENMELDQLCEVRQQQQPVPKTSNPMFNYASNSGPPPRNSRGGYQARSGGFSESNNAPGLSSAIEPRGAAPATASGAKPAKKK